MNSENVLWAFRLPMGLPGIQKFVLMMLCDHAGPDGRGLFPSGYELARKTAFEHEDVVAALRQSA